MFSCSEKRSENSRKYSIRKFENCYAIPLSNEDIKDMCGDRPKITGWALGPSEDAAHPRSQRDSSNPYSGSLGQRKHVQGVISPRILQNSE